MCPEPGTFGTIERVSSFVLFIFFGNLRGALCCVFRHPHCYVNYFIYLKLKVKTFLKENYIFVFYY